MARRELFSNAGALALVVASSSALAQSDAAAPFDSGAVDLPEVSAASPVGASGGGGGPGGFGGAGPAQDPFNTTYVLEDATTAVKTDTPVMNTPLNVQVITQQVLRDQQAVTLEQALQNVSGVTVTGGGALGNGTPYNQVVIRGFPSTTRYRDGFRIDNGTSVIDGVSTTQLANVSSIEVLKGPAAMLYGLVEPGGIVNVITKEPLNAPYYSAQQQIGSFANYRSTVDATGPVTQDGAWLYRMNMSYQNNAAPFGSPVDLVNSSDIFIAPVLKWNIDPGTWVKLEAQYDENRSKLFTGYDPAINGQFMNITRKRNYGEDSPAVQKDLFAALTWSHHFDNDWSVKQQIAYDRTDLDWTSRLPFGPIGGLVWRTDYQLPTTQSTYSTNVDITGHINTFGIKHTLLLGGDVYGNRITNSSSFLLGYSKIDLFDPVHPGTPYLGSSIPLGAYTQNQLTSGLYLQDQIELPLNFFVMAGARYQFIHQTLASGDTLGELTPDPYPQTNSALTPRFGLLWRPQNWLSFYGNYAENFGANTGLIYPNTPVPPTGAQQVEGGVKLELFDGRLRATADYYTLTKTNVPTTDPLHINNVLVTGAVRSTGPELDVQGTLLPGWDVILNYANQDVRVVRSNNGDLGQRWPNVPRNLGTFWTTYEFQQEELRGWKIGGGVVYHGSQPIQVGYDLSVTPTRAMLSGYATVNLMAAYSFKLNEAKVTAQVNVTNLFDVTYYTMGYMRAAPSASFSQANRLYGAPFTVMGSLRAEF
ncbi:TonB-dependent siderophore receptor [Methylocapsa palsarum]|uniref:Iron complex outermembrane recepter protein n=1 Tax=Methylocapsa palsarum TaxID=1612308 RepID=A0A1I3W8F8_9HYPH|nr:TonB-dependent siderophore receptor [Methylocapsa palsarum]SFK03559.1 iron complex outermembrane recepter protein [Methylocapsa palsarum]